MMNPKKHLTRLGSLRLILANGVVIALLLLLNACGKQPTATPIETPTNTPTPAPTLTPTPTLLAPLDGRGGGVIAFTSMETNDWQIYVMNADGSGKRNITINVRGGYEPTWSPDGTELVFQYNGLWIANIESGEIIQIPLSVEENNLPNEYLVKPSWSPNGEWIAFLNESGMFGDLYLIRPDGSDLIRLTNTDDVSRDGDLVWSPDGKQIAYSAKRDGNIEIYLLDVENAIQGNAASQTLTDTPAPVQNLVTSWSPDGSRLAFSSNRDGNMEIYLMTPEGNDIVRLTNNVTSDAEPRWSPDGKQIVFSSSRDGNVEIYVLNVEGAIQSGNDAIARRLTDHIGDDTGPVWSPRP
jgi:Tol biopolymer transport system component